MNIHETLKHLLAVERPLVMPDAYDPLSAKLIELAGCTAVQCSGFSMSLQRCYREETNLSMDQNLAITESIVKAVSLPVMADGEDGYADGKRFVDNLESFIKTGIAGINIEDQNLWNPGRGGRIVDEGLMVDKIRAAVKLKLDRGIPAFVINARTDALAVCEDRAAACTLAIERANRYLAAGADLCFVTYTKTLDEVRLFAREITGPVSIAAGMPYNIGAFTINDCREAGVARVSLPTMVILSSIQAVMRNLEGIRETGIFEKIIGEDSIYRDVAGLVGTFT